MCLDRQGFYRHYGLFLLGLHWMLLVLVTCVVLVPGGLVPSGLAGGGGVAGVGGWTPMG